MAVRWRYYAGLSTNPTISPQMRVFTNLYEAEGAASSQPLSVLDVGCGRDALLSAAVRSGDRYVGSDLIEPTKSLQHFVRADLNEPASALRFGGETYDVIFCGEVIEHVFDPDALIDGLTELLPPAGLLLMSTPNLAYWVNRILLPLGISPLFIENSARAKLGRRFGMLGQGHVTEGHIRVFTHRAFMDMLREHLDLRLESVISVPVWRNPLDALVCRWSAFLAADNVYALRRLG